MRKLPGQATVSAQHPSGQSSESYFYDLNGNRTSGGLSYDVAGRLSDDGGHVYTYDAEGNLATKTEKTALAPTTRFSWDPEGRLRTVTKPNGDQTSYRYDPLGRRIEVAGPGGTKRFGYGADDNAVAEYDAQNALTATHTFYGAVDRPLATHRGSASYYQLQDGQNNVTSLTDSAGQAVERYRYGAYGQPVAGVPSARNPFMFAAREWDGESGTYHNRARQYDPLSVGS